MDDLDRRELYLRVARMQIDRRLALLKVQRAMREATRAYAAFNMQHAAITLACTDIREFDNRAHDWIKAD